MEIDFIGTLVFCKGINKIDILKNGEKDGNNIKA